MVICKLSQIIHIKQSTILVTPLLHPGWGALIYLGHNIPDQLVFHISFSNYMPVTQILYDDHIYHVLLGNVKQLNYTDSTY